MKPTPRFNSALFKSDRNEQPIRVIKAAQASKLLGLASGPGAGHVHNANEPHKKPEIRMIQATADYCDLEVVCSCGESTRVRCWNSHTEEKAVAA